MIFCTFCGTVSSGIREGNNLFCQVERIREERRSTDIGAITVTMAPEERVRKRDTAGTIFEHVDGFRISYPYPSNV